MDMERHLGGCMILPFPDLSGARFGVPPSAAELVRDLEYPGSIGSYHSNDIDDDHLFYIP